MGKLTIRFLRDYTVKDRERTQYVKGQEVTFPTPSAMHFVNLNVAEEVTGAVPNPTLAHPDTSLTDMAESKRRIRGGKTFETAQEEFRSASLEAAGENV